VRFYSARGPTGRRSAASQEVARRSRSIKSAGLRQQQLLYVRISGLYVAVWVARNVVDVVALISTG
jgi:hypothetical protein